MFDLWIRIDTAKQFSFHANDHLRHQQWQSEYIWMAGILCSWHSSYIR